MTAGEPVFPSKWDFLFATVLLGFDEDARQFFSQLDESGRPLLSVWTDEPTAAAALPERFRLLSSPVGPRLAELPAGVGVVVDPDTPRALVLPPEYAVDVKRYLDPFPAGTRSTFMDWPTLPRDVRRALADAAGRYAFVDRVWALAYTIDDSPALGLLVYETTGGDEAQESIVDALDAALSHSTTPAALGVPVVRILALGDLAPEVQAAVDQQPPLRSG